MTEPAVRTRVVVRGVVQGVGFRPFVWRHACALGLSGFVRNTSGSVVIEVEGRPAAVEAFVETLRRDPPPLARVDAIECDSLAPAGGSGFSIAASAPVPGEYQPVAADAATCAACVAELFDPADRRHRYPFINCTDCGPRFTIIEDLPYDRPLTTMRHFTMCADCAREYEDPADRRFHAQPNACPVCGPRLWCTDTQGLEVHGDAIGLAAGCLMDGGTVALKGMGGFQLACDATDEAAVQRLRSRKRRPRKPFAVMVGDLDMLDQICCAGASEAELLSSSARPIVLLAARPGAVAAGVAPGLGELGVMLPSTPLHHLLFDVLRRPLVMTSGNLSEEPIAKDNDEALERLCGIADRFLLHDRGIHARYDDSVVRLVDGSPRMVRRARGYAPLPLPLPLPDATPVVAAFGSHLKNTFTILEDGRAFVSPHIGDLDHPLTLLHHAEVLGTYLRLFAAHPSVVACDTHPDHASTRIAESWWEGGAAAVTVQHHHAHVASVMAEHGLRGTVLGVALDGVGHGDDGTIWGGELLLCDERGYRRAGHLAAVRQPGGDACARQGWRMAAAYLVAAGLPAAEVPAAVRSSGEGPEARPWRLVARLAGSPAAPLSTSAGRLFDAVASLLGVAQNSTFEAEAAMRLEALAAAAAGPPPIAVARGGSPLVLDTVSLVATLAERQRRGEPVAELARCFHDSLALAIAEACLTLASEHGVRRVALSGGVFQNALLLASLERLLGERGLEVYSNRAVPANDGGVSLGQALVAASRAEVA
ncbi:MAG: carbamoyltransferase HypF [Candidatus Dormibacteria bacterium]